MNAVSFFMYYFSFTVEIVFASLLFAHVFDRKRIWWLYITLGSGFMVLISYFWDPSFDREGIWGNTLKYFAFYFIIVIIIWRCFECGIWGAFFCGTMGYCIQHITYNVFSISARLASIHVIGTVAGNILHILCFAVSYSVLIFITRHSYLKNKETMQRKFMENWSIILFGSVFVTIATLLDNIMMVTIDEYKAWKLTYLVNIYLIIVSIFIVYILLAAVRERRAQEELKSLRLLLHSQHKVYRNNKEIIDNINLKAHDLKHQIHAIGGSIAKEQADEMEHLVNMYDATFHTGNEALDVVLTEKGVRCAHCGILLTCLLDARHIKNFSDTDIYSFFGNAIDNAIDAVESLPEEKRIISITENVQANLMNIRIENYCGTAPILFEDGLPMTKRDTRYHGFGTKSMKLIAEKYGGSIFFAQEDDKFVVNLILPTS